MDGGQWLTVQEFAKAAGVSDKAIYSRLNGDLKPYLKTDKKRKYVNSAALDSINFQSVESRKNQEDSNRINLIQEVERLKAERDQLREQLHALEISAAVSAAERDAARQHEQEQMQIITRLSDALHTAQAQLTAAQMLHAGSLQKQISAGKSADGQSVEVVKADAVPVSQPAETVKPNPTIRATTTAPRSHTDKKKPDTGGFFRSLFRKKKKEKA